LVWHQSVGTEARKVKGHGGGGGDSELKAMKLLRFVCLL